MNKLLNLIFILAFALPSFGQNLLCSRTAGLIDGDYAIEGLAHLEKYDNGDLKVRLDSTFWTQQGPDVQIFLSHDSTDVNGAIFIADIGTGPGGISHFSGEITFDVPMGIDIDDYAYLIFRCVQFQGHWATGVWEDSNCYLCQSSATATTNWVTEVDVCPNDGISDLIPLLNSIGVPAGDNYAFVFADENNNIEFLHYQDSYDFEGTDTTVNRIFGISYDGVLTYTVGDHISTIDAGGCSQLSDESLYLTVTKNGCTVSDLRDESSANSVSFFPNPTSSTIYFSQLVKELNLFDMQGKAILQRQLVNEIDLSSLGNGIYLIQMDGAWQRVVVGK